MAAQPIVIDSYDHPVETFMVNVMGTIHVLEAVRSVPSVRAIVNVTSDKCYQNQGWSRAYRECDRMGGSDPYSASKGAAELVTSSYRDSFFADGPPLASARSGNTIGGGDWAPHRLVPDLVRAFAGSTRAQIRNPKSIRPWQHVLEPLAGYLALAYSLSSHGQEYASGWNFGPIEKEQINVEKFAHMFAQAWGRDEQMLSFQAYGDGERHEARQLSLDASKAREQLGWRPIMSLQETVSTTVDWYRAFYDGQRSMSEVTVDQICAYSRQLGAV